ncbi:MAG: hypothetical protein WDZ52_04590 [Pseudohongiellaceae bacterium]
MAMHEGMNTRQLAQGVGRNYKNVYTDVNALADLGLLDKSDGGGFTAAFDEIVIRAPLHDVDSLQSVQLRIALL